MASQKQLNVKQSSVGITSKGSSKISYLTNNVKSSRGLQLILAITFLGAFLRIYQLGTESVWLDEATTYLMSSNTLSGIYETTKGDVHPPLYYFVVEPISKL